VGEQEIAVVLPKAVSFREGDRLALDFPAASLHAFDRETGLRLTAANAARQETAAPLVPA
jgi:hypothetical protein